MVAPVERYDEPVRSGLDKSPATGRPAGVIGPCYCAAMNACVFCERPITADTPSVGRPPIAAHATCADAALADDRHWDEIATGTPEPDEPAD